MKRGERGSSVVELAIVLVPLIFLLISTFEVGRGMWMYHTLSAALKSGIRYAVVHGAECIEITNTCRTSVGDVVNVIKQKGVGLDPSALQLTLTAGEATVTCSTLTACASDSSQWPPEPYNGPGQKIVIGASYGFRSVLSGFWPGQSGGVVTYAGKASEAVQF